MCFTQLVLCVHGVLVYCITFVIHGTLILTELIQLVLYWKIQTNKKKTLHWKYSLDSLLIHHRLSTHHLLSVHVFGLWEESPTAHKRRQCKLHTRKVQQGFNLVALRWQCCSLSYRALSANQLFMQSVLRCHCLEQALKIKLNCMQLMDQCVHLQLTVSHIQ